MSGRTPASARGDGALDPLDPIGAWELFTTPPERPPSREERRILDLADERSFLEYPHERMDGLGRSLALHSWGRGPTVLLVHGWGGHGAQLGSFVEPLAARGFRVLALDAPAHGLSDGRRTNVYEFAHAVATVIERCGPVHAVVGHSLGATGAAMAASWGRSVGRLVLIAGLGSLYDEVTSFARRHALEDELVRGMRRYMEDSFAGIWAETSLSVLAPRVDAPALIVHDERDPRVEFRHAVELARAWKRGELFATSGLGHLAPLRDRGVIERTLAFLVEASGDPPDAARGRRR